MSNSRPTVVDLFAGAGGFGLGFSWAGFEVPLSVEIDTWACDTLRHNHPAMTVIQEDLRNLTTSESVREVCRYQPDMIIGGPPCQGFSIAGPAQKDPKDPRNSLFTNFALWVETLEPKAFVMENVKGLLSRRNAEGELVVEIIRRTFSDLGYLVEVWVLNAVEYGVPQVRERVFIVGHRHETELGKPSGTHSAAVRNSNGARQPQLLEEEFEDAVTVWDTISDLPELEAGEGMEEQPYLLQPSTPFQAWTRGDNEVLYNHVAMSHTKRLVERFRVVGWGESSSGVSEEHWARRRSGNGALSGKMYDQNNRRLHPYKSSHTITASFYANFIHPFQHRNLTAREGARLQSFPDDYRFLGKKTVVSHKLLHREKRFNEKYLCQYNQIGNAVPPLMAKAVAAHLRTELRI